MFRRNSLKSVPAFGLRVAKSVPKLGLVGSLKLSYVVQSFFAHE